MKAHSKRQQVAAREVLVRKKNVHHGDGKALEPVHEEAVGALPWEVVMAELDQPSAIWSSFAGQPTSKKGLDRRPWSRYLLPKLLFEPMIHGIHVHEILPRLT